MVTSSGTSTVSPKARTLFDAGAIAKTANAVKAIKSRGAFLLIL